MPILISLYVLLFAFLISTWYIEKLKKHHLLAKALNSLAFVAAGFYFAQTGGAFSSTYFAFTIAALLLCMVGDILLAVTPGKAGSMWFFAGVATFLLAHLVFCVGFSRLAPFTVVDFIFPIAFVGLIYALTGMKNMQIGTMRPVVCLYSFFVALLASKSITLFLALGAFPGTWLLMLGAILFCLSDLILLFVYFSTKEMPFLRFANLFVYYAATILLAASIRYI